MLETLRKWLAERDRKARAARLLETRRELAGVSAQLATEWHMSSLSRTYYPVVMSDLSKRKALLEFEIKQLEEVEESKNPVRA